MGCTYVDNGKSVHCFWYRSQLESLLVPDEDTKPDDSTLIDAQADVLRQRAFHGKLLVTQLMGPLKDQTRHERWMRVVFGGVLLPLFGGESAWALHLLSLVGRDRLKLTQWETSVFFTAVFAQAGTLLGYVIKYLFSDRPDQLIKLMIEGMFRRNV